jgi:hypothetical protein
MKVRAANSFCAFNAREIACYYNDDGKFVFAANANDSHDILSNDR